MTLFVMQNEIYVHLKEHFLLTDHLFFMDLPEFCVIEQPSLQKKIRPNPTF